MLAGALAASLCSGAPRGATAQEPDTVPPVVDSVIVTPEVPVATIPAEGDTTPALPLTPRAAFIRSMIVPGWGQSAFGSYFRGGVYFSGWAGNWYMNFRNAVRLDNARDRYGRRRDALRDALIVGSPNPDSMRAVLDTTDILETVVREDTVANDLRKLVRAREQQREDWIAWTLFWILASGVDGYVTAHLADFPATIDVEPARDGSVSVRLEVPLGRRKP